MDGFADAFQLLLSVIRGMTHLALNVANLVEAERYYSGLSSWKLPFVTRSKVDDRPRLVRASPGNPLSQRSDAGALQSVAPLIQEGTVRRACPVVE